MDLTEKENFSNNNNNNNNNKLYLNTESTSFKNINALPESRELDIQIYTHTHIE